jgi:hypothetical protein
MQAYRQQSRHIGVDPDRIVFTEASGTLRIVAKLFAFISVIITGA